MKIPETLKTRKAEDIFSAALLAALLLFIPFIHFPGRIWGGVAILAVSVIGLIGCFILFGERRGLRKMAFGATVAGAIGVSIVTAIWLIHRIWQ